MRYGFGIDVGGTAIKLGVFEETGALRERWEIPTRTENGGAGILPDIAAELRAYRARNREGEPLGIGIGVPGPVRADGLVNRCVNLNWGVFNLRDALGALTGMRVRAGNDADCAALGEYRMGGGRGSGSMLFVTLGTGIGGGLVIGGKLLNGAHGVAGEIGHITVNAPDRARCTCGKRGCVECYASAPGIVRLMEQRLAEDGAPSALRGAGELTAERVFAAAKAGDRLAAEVLDRVFDYLGQALASACCVCDPERVVLGGGVSAAGDYLLEGVSRHFRAHMFHACRDTHFALATLGNDAGMYGAFGLLETEE